MGQDSGCRPRASRIDSGDRAPCGDDVKGPIDVRASPRLRRARCERADSLIGALDVGGRRTIEMPRPDRGELARSPRHHAERLCCRRECREIDRDAPVMDLVDVRLDQRDSRSRSSSPAIGNRPAPTDAVRDRHSGAAKTRSTL